MINPCIGCVPPKRYPGCHDRCPQRAEYKAAEDARKELVRKNKSTYLSATEFRVTQISRTARRKMNER